MIQSDKFEKYIEWNDSSICGMALLKSQIGDFIGRSQLAGELFSFLRSKHTRGAEGKSINVYRIDNGEEIWCGTYPTIRECAKAVGSGESTIKKCIKRSQGVMKSKRLKFVQV